MELYLVRHGEAVSGHENVERPLSERGVEDVKRVAEHLKRDGVQIDTVFYSTKKRAEETARILAEILNPQCKLIQKQELSPDSSVGPILDEISKAGENLMIVGHMPFLGKLAKKLLASLNYNQTFAFDPGSVLFITRSGTKWDVIGFIKPDSI